MQIFKNTWNVVLICWTPRTQNPYWLLPWPTLCSCTALYIHTSRIYTHILSIHFGGRTHVSDCDFVIKSNFLKLSNLGFGISDMGPRHRRSLHGLGVTGACVCVCAMCAYKYAHTWERVWFLSKDMMAETRRERWRCFWCEWCCTHTRVRAYTTLIEL